MPTLCKINIVGNALCAWGDKRTESLFRLTVLFFEDVCGIINIKLLVSMQYLLMLYTKILMPEMRHIKIFMRDEPIFRLWKADYESYRYY